MHILSNRRNSIRETPEIPEKALRIRGMTPEAYMRALKIHKSRPSKSRKIDESVWTRPPPHVTLWFKDPNKWDIPGIDTPDVRMRRKARAGVLLPRLVEGILERRGGSLPERASVEVHSRGELKIAIKGRDDVVVSIGQAKPEHICSVLGIEVRRSGGLVCRASMSRETLAERLIALSSRYSSLAMRVINRLVPSITIDKNISKARRRYKGLPSLDKTTSWVVIWRIRVPKTIVPRSEGKGGLRPEIYVPRLLVQAYRLPWPDWVRWYNSEVVKKLDPKIQGRMYFAWGNYLVFRALPKTPYGKYRVYIPTPEEVEKDFETVVKPLTQKTLKYITSQALKAGVPVYLVDLVALCNPKKFAKDDKWSCSRSELERVVRVLKLRKPQVKVEVRMKGEVVPSLFPTRWVEVRIRGVSKRVVESILKGRPYYIEEREGKAGKYISLHLYNYRDLAKLLAELKSRGVEVTPPEYYLPTKRFRFILKSVRRITKPVKKPALKLYEG